MIKGLFTGGLLGFLVGLCYGIYISVEPETSLLSELIHSIAKLKGLW